MLGHVLDTDYNNELISQLSENDKLLIQKDMAIGVLVDAMVVMDLDPLIVQDFISNTLTISCLDSNGNGKMRRMRYDYKAIDGLNKLRNMGIIPYHCIYDELSDTYYYMATDSTGETDNAFFLQIIGYISHINDIGNDAALCWFDQSGQYHLETVDIDVHDGVFYIVKHYPELRNIDGITCEERFKKIIKYMPACYFEEFGAYDYGEPFTTGNPEYDRVYEASNSL